MSLRVVPMGMHLCYTETTQKKRTMSRTFHILIGRSFGSPDSCSLLSQAAGFGERGERIVYRRSIPMVSSPSGDVSRNGVANKAREAGTTGVASLGPFMKSRAACSYFQVVKPTERSRPRDLFAATIAISSIRSRR